MKQERNLRAREKKTKKNERGGVKEEEIRTIKEGRKERKKSSRKGKK